MSPFAERLEAVRERIRSTGRDLEEIAIVAVSKGRSLEECREALSAGVHALGENRVQEALPKLEALSEAEWHLVGHLQRNKVRQVSGRFRLIQSLDSVQLAELRLRCQDVTGRPLPILSMGMSGDFEAACRAGSTMLRLGRVLFESPRA